MLATSSAEGSIKFFFSFTAQLSGFLARKEYNRIISISNGSHRMHSLVFLLSLILVTDIFGTILALLQRLPSKLILLHTKKTPYRSKVLRQLNLHTTPSNIMAGIIDGNAIAAQIRQELKVKVDEMKGSTGVTPGSGSSPRRR